jgi:hypothetical protein
MDASDKRCGLISGPADANRFRLAGYPGVTDVDVVVARGKIGASAAANGDVEGASCVARERIVPDGRVEAGDCVLKEREVTVGRIG